MLSKISKIVNKIPKKTTSLVVIMATLLAGTWAVGAWWPERPTFTINNPAPYVTFNSITNNPNYGDERMFFDAKPVSNTSTGGFLDQNTVQNGQEYLLRIYVHNNAADNLNADGKGVARDTKVRIWLPTVTDQAMRANAYISSSNASPIEVSDSTDFVSSTKFKMNYVPGSAIMYTNAVPGGFKLSDSIVGNGAPIGYEGPNGVMPGCFQYTGIVTIKVKIQSETPDFKVDKTVSKDKIKESDQYNWVETVDAKPGETVAFQIRFSNIGNTQINNAIIRDQLPKGFSIVPGSTLAKYGNDPAIKPVGNDGIVSNGGIDIGSYSPNSGAVVMFKAKAPEEKDLNCGLNQLVNIAEARVGQAFTTDRAGVNINRECVKPTPTYSCDMLTVDVIGPKKIRATVKTSEANGAVYKDTKFTFGDSSSQISTSKSVEHQYDKEGTFIITATPSFMVDGKLVTAESQNCIKQITLKKDMCPINPNIPADDPRCKPCEYNPNIPFDDPNCKAPVVVTTANVKPGSGGGTYTSLPTQIPSTGPEDMLGLFAGVSLAGTMSFRLWKTRKEN